jgi:hypothetical protein
MRIELKKAQLPSRKRLELLANPKLECTTFSKQERAAMARALLAAHEQEPVAYMYRDNLHTDARFSLEPRFGNWSPEDISEYEISETPLYDHPAPSIPAMPMKNTNASMILIFLNILLLFLNVCRFHNPNTYFV